MDRSNVRNWRPYNLRSIYEKGSDYRCDRVRMVLPGGDSARQGLSGARHRAARLHLQHRAVGYDLRRSARRGAAPVSPLRRFSDGTGIRHVLEAAQPGRFTIWPRNRTCASVSIERSTPGMWWPRGHCVCSKRCAITQTGKKDVRFYQAGSSEMFGDSNPTQSEVTPVLSAQSLWGEQSCRALVNGQLSRGLRVVHRQRNSFQS